MNEPNQINLLTEKVDSKRKVEYVPPHSDLVTELAHTACQQLGQQDAIYKNPEVVGGLASFLTFLSQRLAIYASKGHQELLSKKPV